MINLCEKLFWLTPWDTD